MPSSLEQPFSERTHLKTLPPFRLPPPPPFAPFSHSRAATEREGPLNETGEGKMMKTGRRWYPDMQREGGGHEHLHGNEEERLKQESMAGALFRHDGNQTSAAGIYAVRD